MKEYVPVVKDCEHCSKKRGSFGCCSTVNNNWVYSCAEGQKEWVLDKIRAEIEQLRLHKAQFLTNDNKVCVDSQEVLNILDKYKTESEANNGR